MVGSHGGTHTRLLQPVHDLHGNFCSNSEYHSNSTYGETPQEVDTVVENQKVLNDYNCITEIVPHYSPAHISST